MKLSDTEIDTLLTDLSGRDDEKREKAEHFVQEHKTKIFPSLLNYYQQSIVPQQTWALRERKLSFFVLGIIGLGWLANVLQFRFSGQTLFMIAIFAGLIGLQSVVSKAKRHRKLSHWNTTIIKTMIRLEEPRFIGYLIDLECVEKVFGCGKVCL